MKTTTSSMCVGVLFAVALFSIVFPVAGHCHDTWIAMDGYTIEKSGPVSFVVANAHSLVIPVSGKDTLPGEQIDRAFFVGPDCKEVPSIPEGKDRFRTNGSPAQEGSYVAVIKKKSGFSSRTVDGYKAGQTKKDLKDVIECGYSEKYAKALFTVGAAGGNAFSHVLGQAMEIV